jgi:hypothetical protein
MMNLQRREAKRMVDVSGFKEAGVPEIESAGVKG